MLTHCRCVLWTPQTTPGSAAFYPVVLRNQGTMRVANVSVLGSGSNNCSMALMHAYETRNCWMQQTLVQQDYEAGVFTIQATNISGVANGPVLLPHAQADVTSTATPPLAQVRLLNLSLAVNASAVHRAGDVAAYTATAVNNGNIRVRHSHTHSCTTASGL
jgi:hypothetical protein